MTPFPMGVNGQSSICHALFLLLNEGLERFKFEELDGLTNGLTGTIDDNFKLVQVSQGAFPIQKLILFHFFYFFVLCGQAKVVMSVAKM